MLRQISINNFAIVDSVILEFGPGFNVLTGETGAGKSLIVDGLYFLLGDRFDPEFLRVGEERMWVEAIFQASPDSSVVELLREKGIDPQDGEIHMKREYSRSSLKTRSFINGELASAALVMKVGEGLLDIHGQHEHQAIFDTARHKKLIDAFGLLEMPLESTRKTCQALRALAQERENLGGDPREIARKTDLLQFQVNEITSAHLSEINEEELTRQYQRLKHAEKITGYLAQAQRLLDEEAGSGATGLFGLAIGKMKDAARLDPELEKMIETGSPLQESLNQFSYDLARQLESYSFTEEEFQQLSDQIDRLTALKKKYGSTVAEIIEYYRKIEIELKALQGRDQRLKEIEKEIAQRAAEYLREAGFLSVQRKESGEKLALQVESALKELGLSHAQLGVRVTPIEDPDSPAVQDGRGWALGPEGYDKVEFMFSANPGEPLRPLAKVASGGEASRVMLALKTVLSESDEVETLIFDEIDTGVGARSASAVANLLLRLEKAKQLLCISHLAPIAGLGMHHFHVVKSIENEKTSIAVYRLTGDKRIDELAKMLGGEPITETSRFHAKELFARIHGS
jgi:DNA repair protein RecN (Recombination protein N)